MGRKKRVTIRFSDEERQRYEAAAARLGTDFSKFVRRACDALADKALSEYKQFYVAVSYDGVVKRTHPLPAEVDPEDEKAVSRFVMKSELESGVDGRAFIRAVWEVVGETR